MPVPVMPLVELPIPVPVMPLVELPIPVPVMPCVELPMPVPVEDPIPVRPSVVGHSSARQKFAPRTCTYLRRYQHGDRLCWRGLTYVGPGDDSESYGLRWRRCRMYRWCCGHALRHHCQIHVELIRMIVTYRDRHPSRCHRSNQCQTYRRCCSCRSNHSLRCQTGDGRLSADPH